jgi:hypothetical protein
MLLMFVQVSKPRRESMKRLLLAFAAITIFATVICAQEHGQGATRPERPGSKWFTYTSAEGLYSVSLMEQPKLSSQNITAASGSEMVQYMAGASADPAYLMVGYFDYPPTNTFSLTAARDGMVESLHGTLIGDDAISLGGAPGRAVKISARTEAGLDFIDRARFYDINRRIYVLQCLVPVSGEGQAAIQICDQFFDSFKVRNPTN